MLDCGDDLEVSDNELDDELTLESGNFNEDDDINSCGTQETSEMSTFNEYDMTDDDQTSSPCQHRYTLTSDGQDVDSLLTTQSGAAYDEQSFEDFGEVPGDQSMEMQYTNNNKLGSIINRLELSAGSDGLLDNIDESFVQFSEKVESLEQQVQSLTDAQRRSLEKQTKLKEENSYLVERVHQLEEQVRELEIHNRTTAAEEQKKHRDVMTRLEKDTTTDFEIVQTRLQSVEKDYERLKAESPRLFQDNEYLKKENNQLDEQLAKAQNEVIKTQKDYTGLHDQWLEDREKMEQERTVNAQLVDELSKELDELRQSQHEIASRSSPSSNMSRSLRKQVQAQLTQLKTDNQTLHEANEELQAQLLSSHVREGKSLVQMGRAASIAHEMDNFSKDQLVKTLREKQEENAKLRDYVEALTLRIMDKNPSLLEVPNGVKRK